MIRNCIRKLIVTIATAAAALFATVTAGADTFQIEIDYMGADSDGHDHMPDQLVLDAVIQMFACQGHTLIIDLDDEVPHYDFLTGNPNDNCSDFFGYTGASNTYRSIRNIYRDQGAGWHYAIFAHQWMKGSSDPNTPPGCYETSSSGLASGGDAFVVTLGAWDYQTGTLFEQAALLAHEFGHNLGLSHCGTCANGNAYLLNMPSIMTYQYTTAGVRSGLLALGLMPDVALFKELDYSHGRGCDLDETNLDEIRGTLMMSVDFNCDDDTNDAGFAQDLNFGGFGIGSNAPWCGQDPNDFAYAVIQDYNEWGNLDDGATLTSRGNSGDGEALFELSRRRSIIEPCITKEERDRIVRDLQLEERGPTLEVEPCINGQNVYIGDLNFVEIGTCTFPFATIQGAQAASPDDSVYYIESGVYDEPGVTVLSKPGVYTCNTGVAEIR